jgi:2-C-methyl-D-erythritol 2,4-cyclodiphosphate synthase
MGGRRFGLLLSTTVKEITGRRWKIVNLDCTISAEEPRFSPYKKAIRDRVANLLQIPAENVNVKAKTGEGVGPVGRQEVIEAEAVVLLCREPSGAETT